MRQLVSISLLVALPGGCAYQQAIRHGDEAGAAGEWHRAYDAYRYANEVKPGKADGPLAAARDKAIEAEIALANTAVGARDYAVAYDHLDAADRLVTTSPDPRTTAARDAAREALLADLAARMADVKDLSEAYAFVALAKGLQPHSPEVEDAAASLRARVEADTQAKLDRGEFAEARETARLMAALEPEQRTRGAALERTVSDVWVAELVEDAKAAERTRPALAAVYWTRAHEVGGVAAHAESAQGALAAASADAPLAVFVDTQGSGGRHWRLRKSVRAGVGGLPSVESGSTTRWDLSATLVAGDERCTETSVKKPIEKEYQAGTKQVPNPAWADISGVLTAAEAEQKAATAEVDKRRVAHDKAAAATRLLVADRERKQKAYDEKVATLDATKVQIAASADRVAEAEKELAALGEGGNATTVAQVKQQLGLVRGFNDEWTRKKVQDQAAVDTAKAALDAVDAQLAPAKKTEEERSVALKEGETRLTEAKARVAEFTAKRNDTPKTNTEKVMDVAKVNETTWTMTCTGPVSVRYGTTWPTGRSRSQSVQGKVESTDVERPAHVGAAIEADPKAYPKSKADLVAELDAAATKAVSDEIAALVSESFSKRLEAALAATDDLGSATQVLVSLAAGAPDRVDGAARTKIVEHLKSHYGVEDAAPLGVVAVAAAPAPEATPATAGAAGAPAETPAAAAPPDAPTPPDAATPPAAAPAAAPAGEAGPAAKEEPGGPWGASEG